MLFISPGFIFAFLPAVLLGTWIARRVGGTRAVIGWLAAASLFFYCNWDLGLLALILVSIAFNYCCGIALERSPQTWRRPVLIVGVASNLALLGTFKYANFFLANVEAVTGAELGVAAIALPLGISFFTFQQIAFLVDVNAGRTRTGSLNSYALFVSYFPQLIAGPIVRHKDLVSQFDTIDRARIFSDLTALGLVIFAIGFLKKVGIADAVAPWSTPVFDAADNGAVVGLLDAWTALAAFIFQIYFDFCGYSEMAIGLGLMMGVRLPFNFLTPLQASSMIEFWTRWHVTLSQFLRDYLFVPLGGLRRSRSRRITVVMVTMLLAGLWHGAGWTFVIWGGLQGVYLVVNHLYRTLLGKVAPIPHWLGVILTTGAFTASGVFFRAHTIEGAWIMIKGAIGIEGLRSPDGSLIGVLPVWLMDAFQFLTGYAMLPRAAIFVVLAALLALVWTEPSLLPLANSQPVHLVRRLGLTWRWSANPITGAVTAFSLLLGTYLSHQGVTEFIYWHF